MPDEQLIQRTEAHFEMLARETVRLKLNTRESRTAFFRQQRDFLAQSLAGAGVSGQKLAAELEAFDAATGKLETFVDTLVTDQEPAQETSPAEPPQSESKDTHPAAAARPSAGRLSKRLAIVVAVILVLGVSAPFALPGIVYPVFDDARKKLPVQYRHACDTKFGVKDAKQLLAVCTQRIDSWLVFKHDRARAYHLRASAYWNLRKYDLAHTDITNAIALDPDDAATHIFRGNSYLKIIRTKLKKSKSANIEPTATRAITDFSQAIKIDPKQLQAYFGRGATLFSLKKYDKALVEYEQAVLIAPNSVSALFMRANAYLNIKKYDEAEKEFRRLATLKAGNAREKNYQKRAKKFLIKRERDKKSGRAG